MQFHSLVAFWCACAIHFDLQRSTVSGHRSLDETSSRKSADHSPDDVDIPRDVLLEGSSRSISSSSTLFFIPSISRDPSRKSVDRFVPKRDSRGRKRRKKCSRRKQDGARRGTKPRKVKFGDEVAKEESKKNSMQESSPDNIVENATSIDVIANVSASTLNPTPELTTKSSTIQPYFVDIEITTTDGNYHEENRLRKKCKRRIKCARKDCKGNKRKRNLIDIFEEEFVFPPDFGKLNATQRRGPPLR